MAININTYLIQRNIELQRKGVIAVYLSDAVRDGADQAPIFLQNISKLYENFKVVEGVEASEGIPAVDGVNDSENALRELAVMEYILSQRVPVLAIPKKTNLTTTLNSLTNVNERFVSIIAPNIEVSIGLTAPESLEGDASIIAGYVEGRDIKYYIELNISDVATDLPKLEDKEIVANHKVELAYGKFYPSFNSNYIEDMSEFLMPASVLLATKKSQRIIADTPWIPVAGEANGVHREVLKLQYAISEGKKNILQAYGANVLDLKIGVGHFFMSQNTLVANREDNKQNYLIRSHIVSLALHVNEQIRDIASKFQFVPNNQKTWTSLQVKLEGIFNYLISRDAVESMYVVTGRHIMNDEDILEGNLKAVIAYKPVGVIESILIDLYITNEDITLEEVTQGVLPKGVEV